MLHAHPPPNFWILHIDGSAIPNPGRMAVGVVLTGPDGSTHELAQNLPGVGCNNEAELRALHAGLQLAWCHRATAIRVYTDSRWLLEQLAPAALQLPAARATQRLSVWLSLVGDRLALFESVQWRWIPRHHNLQADALARQVALQTH